MARKQPWKAVVEGDQEWLAGLLEHVPELTRGVTEAYAGITAEAFERAVRRFFDTARHPVLGVAYARLGYRPMREPIDMLTASQFEGLYLLSGRPGPRRLDGILTPIRLYKRGVTGTNPVAPTRFPS